MSYSVHKYNEEYRNNVFWLFPWANWIAVDADGKVFIYDEKPYLEDLREQKYWTPPRVPQTQWTSVDMVDLDGINYKDSLFERVKNV